MDFRIIFVLLFCLFCSSKSQNLITNPGFESNIGTEWFCVGNCNIQRTTKGSVYKSGQFSVYLSKRKRANNGLSQYVTLRANTRYTITAQVMTEDITAGEMFQTMTMSVNCENKKGKSIMYTWGITPKMQANKWYELGGVNKIPKGSKNCRLIITTDEGINFYVDDVVATELATPSWKKAALKRINTLRMSPIQISLGGTNVDNRILDVEIKQRKHEFAFGSAVRADMFLVNENLNNSAYQNVFYDNFEWGVVEQRLNWNMMQPSMDSYDAGAVEHAMFEMNRNGIRQRCHSAFEASSENQPSWVKDLSIRELKTAIDDRVGDVTGLTLDMCEHWDVLNEHLQDDFFEKNTSNPWIINRMFNRLYAQDPEALLTLNENQNVEDPGMHTVALKNLALEMQSLSVPVGSLGVQGHFRTFDAYLVKARLDLLAEAGLPIIITEFEVMDANDRKQMTNTRDLLTLFYSHPAVSGVIFWGFWDLSMQNPIAALFTGENFMPNAAGKAYQQLFHNDFRTRAYRTLLGSDMFETTGHRGEYQITVSYQGEVLADETFTLDECGRRFHIVLEGEAGQYPKVDFIARYYASKTTAEILGIPDDFAADETNDDTTGVTDDVTDSVTDDGKGNVTSETSKLTTDATAV